MSKSESVTTWQPIETAPKDGTEVIALWDKSKIIAVVYFHVSTWMDDGAEAVSEPTHWIPMPEMPK